MALDLARLRVFPLATRESFSRVDEILIDPERPPGPCPREAEAIIELAAQKILEARAANAAVMLLFGAHLIRNGAARLMIEMMTRRWVTHLATNGAGSIHDWEYAFAGRSTESVRANVAQGKFGAWDETGRNLNLALLAGGVRGAGYGEAVGQFIAEDGLSLPAAEELARAIREQPEDRFTAARADLLRALIDHHLPAGHYHLAHPWKQISIFGRAHELRVPLTVHPGIGYDIISNHPMFSGAAIGRASALDFLRFGESVEKMDQGVVLSIGSAIMAPQVFEKSLSCVNNLRLQDDRPVIHGHTIFVVDLQAGGAWDWSRGEPPKDNPAYYLRFCKSFSRMGGAMHYSQCDNVAFLHHLRHRLAV